MSNDRLKLLESTISKANEAYYETGSPFLDDDEYDRLVEELRSLTPNHKLLSSVGNNTSGSVLLPKTMPSLDKVRTAASLDSASKGCDRFVVSDKLDGMSALIHLSDGRLKLYTRGNGRRGRDITNITDKLANMNKSVVERIAKQMKENSISSVRGELIVTKKSKPNDTGSILRNFVTGIVNSKSPSKSDLGIIRFVAYEATTSVPTPSEAQLATVSKFMPFVVDHKVLNKKDIDLEGLTSILVKRKKESEYAIDGIVVTKNIPYVSSSKVSNPDHSFAFKSKLAEDGKVTKVTDIEWNISRHGKIVPTVLFSPVIINGSRVERASGKHAAHLLNNGIGTGATVVVAMAGDVIPDIRSVVEPSKKIEYPDIPWKWDSTRTHIVSENESITPEVFAKKLSHFFDKLEVKGYGGALAETLSKKYTYIPDIVNAPRSDITKIMPGIKGSELRNVMVDAVSRATRESLASASGVFPAGVGEKTLKLAFDSEGKTRLENIPGIGDQTASKIEQHMDEFLRFEKDIGFVSKKRKPPSTSNCMRNHTYVFTGFRDKALENAIKDAGGTISGSVGKSSTHLVTPDGKFPSTEKGRKAKTLKLEVVSRDTLATKLYKGD